MPYILSQARSISRSLEQIQLRGPTQKAVILAENSKLGIVPLRLVSNEKRREVPRVLGLKVVLLTWESIDVGPFETGLPPDSTASSRARNKVLHGLIHNFALKGALRALRQYFIEAGADLDYIPRPGELGFNITYDPRVYDKVFQMCLPEVEFPRSDLPGHIQFVGGLPRKPVPADYVYPPWRSDIVTNAELPIAQRQKLVVVAQGTFANDYNDLILPTIQGLGGRSKFLTVAILGKKGARL